MTITVTGPTDQLYTVVRMPDEYLDHPNPAVPQAFFERALREARMVWEHLGRPSDALPIP